MAWVSDNLSSVAVGYSASNTDVISKVFTCEDPRMLAVNVAGGLTNFRVEGRTGSGAWRTIKTQAAGTRLIFTLQEDADLLDEQLRVVAAGSGDVDAVFVSRVL